MSFVRGCIFIVLVAVSGIPVRLHGETDIRLPASIHEKAQRFLSLLYNGEFEASRQTANTLIRRHANNPAGYFFYALSVEVEMVVFKNTEREDEFYRHCEKAIEKAEDMLGNEKHGPWPNFFIGGANGLMGMYEMEMERWITAFRHAWKGIRYLEKVKKKYPSLKDVYFGIGSYEYWRSAKTDQLWWAPSDKDNRKQGIQKLYIAKNQGVYTRESSAHQLVIIFNRESRHVPAMKVVDAFLGKYPHSPVFAWGKARALLGVERYEEARQYLQRLVDTIQKEYPNDTYNLSIAWYELGRLYFQSGEYKKAIRMYDKCLSGSYTKEQREMIADLLKEAKANKNTAASALEK